MSEKMTKKTLIFDSGSIINFSMNGLLDFFSRLKREFDGEFLVTEDVEYEIIKRPLQIKKFELGAMRIKRLLDEKVIELPSCVGVKSSEINEKIKQVLFMANHTFFSEGKNLHLIDRGEASCLALSEILTKKGIKNLIVIDERTTRMLCEKPENLKRLLEIKLHTKIKAKEEYFPYFEKFRFIRSCELAYIGYKKDLVELRADGNILDALLYALKYRGCSISRNEIEHMKRL